LLSGKSIIESLVRSRKIKDHTNYLMKEKQAQVAEDEVLTDSVYLCDPKTDRLEIA